MALSGADLRVHIGFAARPLDAISTVVWTDVSNYVKSYTLTRGRQHQLDKPQAGTLKITLDNKDRRFDPTNTSSPYAPDVKPLRRIRVAWNYAAAGYFRFYGYIESWPVDWTSPMSSTVTLDCVDAFKVLSAAKIPATPLELEMGKDNPTVVYGLDEGQADIALDKSGNRIDGLYQGRPVMNMAPVVEDDPGKSVIFEVGTDSRVSVPYKNLIAGYPFSISAWTHGIPRRVADRMIVSAYNRPTSPNNYMAMQIDGDAGGDLTGHLTFYLVHPGGSTLVSSSSEVDNIGRTHLVAVAASASDFKLYVNGTDVTVVETATATAFPADLNMGYSIGNTPAAPWGDFPFRDRLDEVAIFPSALSAARVTAHYQAGVGTWEADRSGERIGRILDFIGWPAADRFIEAGLSTIRNRLIAGSALAYMQKIEESELGNFFISRLGQVTFFQRHWQNSTASAATFRSTPTTASQLFYESIDFGMDDEEIRNRVEIQRDGGVKQIATHLSIAAYGERLFSREGLLHSSDQVSNDHAHWIKNQYGNPQTRIRQITVNPQSNPATMFPVVLVSDLNSRFTVEANPPGGGPTFTQECHVERIVESYTAGPRESLTFQFGLSKVDDSDYWILGTSTLGTSTTLGY